MSLLVFLPFSACRSHLSTLPWSSVTATPKGTLALRLPPLSTTPCLFSSLTTSFASLRPRPTPSRSPPPLSAPAPFPPLRSPLLPLLPQPMSTRPPKHALARPEADRSRTVESQLWNREGAVDYWRIGHQAHSCSPVARQALFALS